MAARRYGFAATVLRCSLVLAWSGVLGCTAGLPDLAEQPGGLQASGQATLARMGTALADTPQLYGRLTLGAGGASVWRGDWVAADASSWGAAFGPVAPDRYELVAELRSAELPLGALTGAALLSAGNHNQVRLVVDRDRLIDSDQDGFADAEELVTGDPRDPGAVPDDHEPPTFAGLLAATATGPASVSLSWAPAADRHSKPQDLRYRVYVSDPGAADHCPSGQHALELLGQTLATVGETAPGQPLLPETSYTFAVRAVDEAGNESLACNALVEATAALNRPPVFVAPLSQVFTIHEGQSFRLPYQAQDPDGSTEVQVSLGLDTLGVRLEPWYPAGFGHLVVWPSFADGGGTPGGGLPYLIELRASDGQATSTLLLQITVLHTDLPPRLVLIEDALADEAAVRASAGCADLDTLSDAPPPQHLASLAPQLLQSQALTRLDLRGVDCDGDPVLVEVLSSQVRASLFAGAPRAGESTPAVLELEPRSSESGRRWLLLRVAHPERRESAAIIRLPLDVVAHRPVQATVTPVASFDPPVAATTGYFDGGSAEQLVSVHQHGDERFSVVAWQRHARGRVSNPTVRYDGRSGAVVPRLQLARSADVDGDGLQDLILATGDLYEPVSDPRLQVLYGAASPGPLVELDDGDGFTCVPSDLAAGDLDGDGQAEVLVACKHWTYGEGVLLVSALAGSPTISVLCQGATSALALADLDGDHDLDLVAGNADFWYSGQGPGALLWRNDSGVLVPGLGVEYERPGPWHDVALGDLDGDGRPELVALAGYTGEERLEFFGQQPDHSWHSLAELAAPTYAERLALADLDGDGLRDLAVRCAVETRRVEAYIAGRDRHGAWTGGYHRGRHALVSDFTAGARVLATTSAGDAVLAAGRTIDAGNEQPALLVIAAGGSQLPWLAKDAASLDLGWPQYSFQGANLASFRHPADGRARLVVAADRFMEVREPIVPGLASLVSTPADAVWQASGVLSADLDGDRLVEHVVTSRRHGGVAIVPNALDPLGFVERYEVDLPTGNARLQDFDGDAVPDLWLPAGSRLFVLTGQANYGLPTGAFNPAALTVPLPSEWVSEIQLQDLSLDGLPEMVGHGASYNHLVVASLQGSYGRPSGALGPTYRLEHSGLEPDCDQPYTLIRDLRLVDLDLDGAPEALLLGYCIDDPGRGLYLSRFDGLSDAGSAGELFTPAAGPSLRLGGTDGRLAVLDLDGDGDQDLLILRPGPAVSTMLRNQAGVLEEQALPLPIVLDGEVIAATVADFDADGLEDVAVLLYLPGALRLAFQLLWGQ